MSSTPIVDGILRTLDEKGVPYDIKGGANKVVKKAYALGGRRGKPKMCSIK